MAWPRRSSPSTATRRRSCGPSPRPSCCATSTRSSSCSSPPASTSPWSSPSTPSAPPRPPRTSCTTVLVDCLRRRVVIVGADFHFGKGRDGNVALLERLGPEPASRSQGMALVDADGRPGRRASRVSSTAIRRALVAGDLAAAACHARPPPRGAGRGRPRRRPRAASWGSPPPTCPCPASILLPADGIYAGWFERPDGIGAPHRHLARPSPDLLRDRRRQPARGPRPRLLAATSTTSTWRSASSSGCGARRGSTRSMPWSSRCTATAIEARRRPGSDAGSAALPIGGPAAILSAMGLMRAMATVVSTRGRDRPAPTRRRRSSPRSGIARRRRRPSRVPVRARPTPARPPVGPAPAGPPRRC